MSITRALQELAHQGSSQALEGRKMTAGMAAQRLRGVASGLLAGGECVAKPVWRLLTLSLTEGVAVPVRAVAVSLEKGGFSVVAGSRFLSRIGARKALSYSLDDGKQAGPERVASAVSLALRELGASRSRITLTIPREWVVVRGVTLPGNVKENLTEVIAYELDRLTPFSAESSYYDFKLLGEEDGKLSLLVAAARRDLVDRYLGALKGEGVRIERLTIGASSLATLAAYACRSPESVCVEVGSHAFQGAHTRANGLSSSFWGAFPSEDAESRIETMAAVLRPVIDSARSRGATPPVMIAAKDGDYGALQKRLDVPVRRLDEESRIRRLSAHGDGLSWAAAGALVESLWPGAAGLNLLEKGSHKRKAVPRAFTMVLIALLLAVWVPYALLPLQREEKRLAEIERQISLRKEEVKKVEYLRKETGDLAEEIALIDQFKRGKPMAVAILKELTAILPKTAWTTRVRITDTGVGIEGYAKAASALLPVLEQSSYLEKVEFSSPIMRDMKLDVERFAIKMEMEGIAPAVSAGAAQPATAGVRARAGAGAPVPPRTGGSGGGGKG